MTKKKKATSPRKRGPKPEVLKVEGDWQEAIKRALDRGKPPNVPLTKKKKNNT